MDAPSLSPEFHLAAACCRWPPSEERTDAIARITGGPVDWTRFIGIVERQRIVGFAQHALADIPAVPPAIRTILNQRASTLALRNLAFASESVRLHKAFETAGFPHLFVKGTTLAILAYGQLQLKTSWDIDMLVAHDALRPADQLLVGLGYDRLVPDPALPEISARRWFDHSKEGIWIHRASGMAVELHSRLVDNPNLLPHIGLASERQAVRVGEGIALPTLARDQLFAYLCVHGTYHAWSRLKWLADAAALIGDDPDEAERLHHSAIRLGAGRCSAVALALCHRLLETRLPDGLATRLLADRGVQRLETTALWAISGGGDGKTELGTGTRTMVRLYFSHLHVIAGWRHWPGEIRRKLFFPYNQQYLRLPLWLWPAYLAARLVLRPFARGAGPSFDS